MCVSFVSGLFNLHATSSIPNNSFVVEQNLATNVTVECSVFNGDGTQLITTWSVTNPYNGNTYEPKFFLRRITPVIYEGTPQYSSANFENIPTFHNRIIFGLYSFVIEDLILNCGAGGYGGNLRLLQFPIKVYRKLL